MRAGTTAALAFILSVAGCGYFNALYNANRRFAEAERAAAQGDARAADAYIESIEKAAASYRSHPEGRWADDALLIIGRARFALGQDDAAAVALRNVLIRTTDTRTAALAHAWLGAALARAGADSALDHLDRAVATLPPRSESAALARYWRAHALFAVDHAADAWADLDALQGLGGRLAVDAALESADRAFDLRDSTRLAASLERLAAIPVTPRSGSRLLDLAHRAAHAGDTAAATAIALRIAASNVDRTAGEARLALARWRLARIHTRAELDDIHDLLDAAHGHIDAASLAHRIDTTRRLIDRAVDERLPLALFAAAELARDDLDAPRLARSLFLDFALNHEAGVWSGKAVIAATTLGPGPDTDSAIARLAKNVYVRAARGLVDADALMLAEERMARGMAGLRAGTARPDTLQRSRP